MSMKTLITILILAIVVIVFSPVYKGERVYCGINPESPCFTDKVNLITYIKNQQKTPKQDAILFMCDTGFPPVGRTGFSIQQWEDGKFRLTIPSKPPVRTILLSQTPILGGYEYAGESVLIVDAPDRFEVTFDGKSLPNCSKGVKN
jgi:hypothetical protein